MMHDFSNKHRIYEAQIMMLNLRVDELEGGPKVPWYVKKAFIKMSERPSTVDGFMKTVEKFLEKQK